MPRKDNLTKRQKRITEIMDKVNDTVRPLLEQEMKEYKKEFGFNEEDIWLMMAGLDIDFVVVTTATKVKVGII